MGIRTLLKRIEQRERCKPSPSSRRTASAFRRMNRRSFVFHQRKKLPPK